MSGGVGGHVGGLMAKRLEYLHEIYKNLIGNMPCGSCLHHDSGNSTRLTEVLTAVVSDLLEDGGQHVLDIGCGTGKWCVPLYDPIGPSTSWMFFRAVEVAERHPSTSVLCSR